MIENDFIGNAKAKRYQGWDGDFGSKIATGGFSLESLAAYTQDNNLDPKHVSGQQELLENQVNQVLFK